MYLGTSSVPKISSGSKSRLKSKEGESWDCNQEQEKRVRIKDYSWMVRFFSGKLFSSTGCFPLSAMSLGVFFWRRRTRGREMMEVYENGFAEHQGGYFISCESASGVMTSCLHQWEYQTAGVSPWMRRVFPLNSVHDSGIRIFYRFYAKGQEFVRIRLE
jgi:hypothetical protein